MIFKEIAIISSFVLLYVILSGCASIQPADSLVLNTDSTRQNLGTVHRLTSGDLLTISVYENPDLKTNVHVPEDGYIPFPLLGNVQVKGLTVLQMDSLITKGLAERYIIDPQVTVIITEYHLRNVYVTGEVRRPGEYPFEDGLTVRKAISLAGGFTEKAAKNKLVLTRIIEGQETSFPIQIDDQIQEEDILTVKRSFF